jgi:hypothetical protein
MKSSNNYLTPTKQNPVFRAECDYTGFIEEGTQWKDYVVTTENNMVTASTFAVNFTNGISELHQWIMDHPWLLKTYPKAKYHLYMIDGSLDKWGDVNYKKVYTITTSRAKQLISCNSL